MSEIMNAWSVMSPAVVPSQLLAQAGEDTFHLVCAQRQSSPSPPRTDEERGGVLRRLTCQVTRPAVAAKRLHGTQMHRYLA